MEIYRHLLQAAAARRRAILATAIAGAAAGRQRLWTGDAVAGSFGDEPLDAAFDQLAAMLPQQGGWFQYQWCGAQNLAAHSLLVEVIVPARELIIFGGGHIAEALSRLGPMLDSVVTVIDDRPAFVNAARFPQAQRLLCADFSQVCAQLELGPWSQLVIMTRGHRHDMTVLSQVIDQDVAYLGMIGSKRRAALVAAACGQRGISREMIARLHMPIGLSIGARTPGEIAISIAAELITERAQQCDTQLGIGLIAGGLTLVAQGAADYAAQEQAALWQALLAGVERGDKPVLAIISRASGSTPRKTGTKMLFFADGRSVGTIGGGCLEAEVRMAAYQVRDEWRPLLLHKALDDMRAAEYGMVCGGQLDVLLLPVGYQETGRALS